MATPRAAELHELLAVRTTRADETKRIAAETTDLFGKPQAFREVDKMYSHLIELEPGAKEALEASKSNVTQMVTTVMERLRYDAGFLRDYMDLRLQVDEGNREAKADLIVNGEVMMNDLPGVFLQPLEGWLVEFRGRIAKAPTVPNSLPVETASIRDLQNVWHVVTPAITLVEETSTIYTEVSKATDKHPAQIKEGQARKLVGTVKEDVWLGMVTSAKKADMLTRIDTLIAAVQAARSRANRVPAPPKRNTQVILDFVLGE